MTEEAQRAYVYTERLTRCGICHQQYDMGQPTVVGEFRYWPDGEVTYRNHCREAHKEVKNATTTWTCGSCGQNTLFNGDGPTLPGWEDESVPTTLLDRRFALAFCRYGVYPTHRPAYGPALGRSGPVIFYKSGTFNNVEQPVQTDPEVLKFVKEEKKRAEPKPRKPRAPRASQDRPRAVRSESSNEGRPSDSSRPIGH